METHPRVDAVERAQIERELPVPSRAHRRLPRADLGPFVLRKRERARRHPAGWVDVEGHGSGLRGCGLVGRSPAATPTLAAPRTDPPPLVQLETDLLDRYKENSRSPPPHTAGCPGRISAHSFFANVNVDAVTLLRVRGWGSGPPSCPVSRWTRATDLYQEQPNCSEFAIISPCVSASGPGRISAHSFFANVNVLVVTLRVG